MFFKKKKEEKRTYDSYWSDFLSNRAVDVNHKTAESISTVYACVSAVSETIASLPLILYKKNENLEKASKHPLYYILHDQANQYQTALEFREWMQACVLLRGNAYAEIVRDNNGQIKQLMPINPDSMTIIKTDNGIVYEFSTNKGEVRRLLQHECFHLKHRASTSEPLLGISPITVARETIELALVERNYGNSSFTNGTKLSGILKFPQKLKPEQRRSLQDSWQTQYGGQNNAGKVPILDEGVDFQTVSMTLEDAEWIAARQFSVEEVARLFRVPPTIIGDLRHGNYSNSVELSRQFVTMTLKRHLVAWEQAISSQLLTDAGRRLYYAEHSVEGLLRGDSTNRAAFYQSGIAAGWLLKDEARRLENLPQLSKEELNAASNQDAQA